MSVWREKLYTSNTFIFFFTHRELCKNCLEKIAPGRNCLTELQWDEIPKPVFSSSSPGFWTLKISPGCVLPSRSEAPEVAGGTRIIGAKRFKVGILSGAPGREGFSFLALCFLPSYFSVGRFISRVSDVQFSFCFANVICVRFFARLFFTRCSFSFILLIFAPFFGARLDVRARARLLNNILNMRRQKIPNCHCHGDGDGDGDGRDHGQSSTKHESTGAIKQRRWSSAVEEKCKIW